MKSRILLTGVGVSALALLSGQGTQPERPGTTDPTRPSQPGSTQPGQPTRPGEPSRPSDPTRPIDPSRPSERPMTPSTPGRDTMTPGRGGQPGTESAPRPGAEHQALGWMQGQWTATATQWRSANSEPMEFTGMLNSTWVLDQRFLRNEFISDKQGMPFQGISFIGYNNSGNEYQGVWMDTTNNEIAHSTGDWNAGSKTLTLNGEFTDPQTNQKVQTRTEARQESPDRFTWEMYNTPQGGTEFKSLQIVFTKRGGGMTPGQRPTTTPGGTTPGMPPSTTTPRSPSSPPSTTPPSSTPPSTRPPTTTPPSSTPPSSPPSDPGRPSTPPPPR